MPNILSIPIDNRPVCYQLPKQIAEVFEQINLLVPPRDLLGGLNTYSDYEGLLSWCQEVTASNEIDYVILSLDAIAYGGLVASRRVELSFDDIKHRVMNFMKCFEASSAKILATSSIMRISNNNINEEEKVYWSEWGEEIFKYSYLSDCTGKTQETAVPVEIMEDYLRTRKRNFDVNKFYIKLLSDGILDYVVFSQDDTAKYGFNVKEAKELAEIIDERKLNACIKTGADEVPLTLLSRAVVEFCGEDVSINSVFLNPLSKNIISRYEDISIENSLAGQVELCGATIDSDAEIDLLINMPSKIQDDIALRIFNDERSYPQFELPSKPFAVADIKLANGADNEFTAGLFTKKSSQNLLGYAAWNTTANSLGSVLSMAIIAYLAKHRECYNQVAHKELLATRLLDDWAYQANIRQSEYVGLKEAFRSYLADVENFLDCEFDCFSAHLPWERSFEVEICLSDN